MHEPCPCDSGLRYQQCCGTAGRTAENADAVIFLKDNDMLTNGQLTTKMKSALDSFASTPDLFPARIDFSRHKAWFVKMSPRWYSESVFLDPARIRGTCLVEINLEKLQLMTQEITWQPSAYIFHTAFCGSTLLAQALGSAFNCLPLREPEVLGNLQTYLASQTKNNEQQKHDWLGNVLRLLSRRFDSRQTAVIKTNDFSNPMMIRLLEYPQHIPVLFMYIPLNEFVVACLKAENRRQWIQSRYLFARKKVSRILTLPDDFVVDINVDETRNYNSYAQMAAVYWSYNIGLYLEAWRQFPDKLNSLDIKTLLTQPREVLAACAEKFDLQSVNTANSDKQINELFSVYSKNSSQKYSPQQRIEDIERMLSQYKLEIDTAEKLAQQLLRDDYPVKQLVGQLM